MAGIDVSFPKGRKGILAFSVNDWQEYAEFNLDLEDNKEAVSMRLNLKPIEYYLIGLWCIKNKISMQDGIKSLISKNGVFDYDVDYEGNTIKNKKNKKEDGQPTLF